MIILIYESVVIDRSTRKRRRTKNKKNSWSSLNFQFNSILNIFSLSFFIFQWDAESRARTKAKWLLSILLRIWNASNAYVRYVCYSLIVILLIKLIDWLIVYVCNNRMMKCSNRRWHIRKIKFRNETMMNIWMKYLRHVSETSVCWHVMWKSQTENKCNDHIERHSTAK